MEQLEDYSDERLKGGCAFCGTAAGVSKDHVPSKGLLRKPYPPNLPVIWACRNCNNGFSADEEYFRLFLHCVLEGTTDPESHRDDSVARGLRRNSKLRTRIERSRSDSASTHNSRIHWTAELDRVNRIIVKNARGHVYYEYGNPPEVEPTSAWAVPIVLIEDQPITSIQGELWDSFVTDGLVAWPEVGCRMMTRVLTGQDMVGAWVVVQDGVYRYSIDDWGGGVRVRTVLHEYLATEVRWEA